MFNDLGKNKLPSSLSRSQLASDVVHNLERTIANELEALVDEDHDIDLAEMYWKGVQKRFGLEE